MSATPETTAALIQRAIEDALMDENCPVVDTFTEKLPGSPRL